VICIDISSPEVLPDVIHRALYFAFYPGTVGRAELRGEPAVMGKMEKLNIYKKVFERLCIKGEILKLNGYFESIQQPNLFCKKLPEGWLYADMRGTERVPIWEDTDPVFYWKFNNEVPLWKRRRLIAAEFTILSEEGCTCRLSHEIDSDTTIELAGCVAIYPAQYASIVWLHGTGFCPQCGKDIQSDDMFCSEKCEIAHEDSFKSISVVCEERYEATQMIKHHTCYEPEITIMVCRGCHNVIHKSDKLPHLKPQAKLPAF
jgi:hypothetical protein